MADFTADPEGLQNVAPLYGAQASELADIYNTLATGLQADWGSWGTCTAGQYFGNVTYGPPCAQTLDQMRVACGGLESTAVGINRWVQNLVNSDQSAQADLNSQLGSG
jgi:hypothetical protein